MTTTDPIESHAIHRERMLRHAAEMIVKGDRLQASEKIWGAAAHCLKEIAEERGWPNKSHADGFAIVDHLVNETGDERIYELFLIANDAHQNFYEDRLSLTALTRSLERVRELTARLDDAHRTLPPDLPMPDDRHYRRRHA